MIELNVFMTKCRGSVQEHKEKRKFNVVVTAMSLLSSLTGPHMAHARKSTLVESIKDGAN